MCGIVGFVDKKDQFSEDDKLRLIKAMREKLSHRGQDNTGEYVDGNVAFGHARLSILDTSNLGTQPMQTQDKSAVITFNGEVYNFRSIAKELSLSLQSGTDTEVILNAYKALGEKSLQKLKGMWAFVLHDKQARLLFLSIDRFGIKPIYYLSNDRFFAFASEIKALFVLPEVRAELNTEALFEQLLFRSIAGNETLFKGIYKMLPAECGTYDLAANTLRLKTFWELQKKDASSDPQEKLASLLKGSIREHLIADVPVGIQLSGGVDSSLVGALAALEKPEGLHSFSIGLKDEKWNEFEHSRKVSQKIGTTHHELLFTEETFCEVLPKLVYHMDEPISHSHSVPMYLLARFAREKVKALLSGEGADEVFGGYRRYEKALQGELSPKEIVLLGSFGKEATMRSLTNLRFEKALDTRLHMLEEVPSDWTTFDKISFLDIKTYLTPLLIRQDKMGMAATLENRVPFLDHELVEFGFSLTERYKLAASKNPHLRTKPLLKEVAETFVPKEIIYRPKVGFGQPISVWLKNEKGLGRFLKILLESPRDFFNKKKIAEIISEHKAGIADHGETLWILLNLELWARMFLDGTKPEEL